MAIDGGDAGGAAIHAGAGDSVRQHCEEEVGRELRLHGIVRVRGDAAVLGDVGVQVVVRRQTAADLGQGGDDAGVHVPAQAGGLAIHHPPLRQRRGGDPPGGRVLRHGGHGAVSVLLRRHHRHPARRLRAGPHELPRLDAVRAALAHLLLHRGRLLRVGRRVSVAVGRHRLRRRLCYPCLVRRRRLRRRLLGGATDTEGPREVSTQQCAAHAHRSGAAVDGVVGLQRRGALQCQHRLRPGGPQHARLRCCQSLDLDYTGRHCVWETVRHWCSARHDDRARHHHTSGRVCAGVGGDGDGDSGGEHTVVVDDVAAQAVGAAAARRRHAGRVPHARGRGAAGRDLRGAVRAAGAVHVHGGGRHELQRAVLRRQRRHAGGEAARGRGVRHRLEHRGHHAHHVLHRLHHAAAHVGGASPGGRRRRARRGGVRALGRRRALRPTPAPRCRARSRPHEPPQRPARRRRRPQHRDSAHLTTTNSSTTDALIKP